MAHTPGLSVSLSLTHTHTQSYISARAHDVYLHVGRVENIISERGFNLIA